MCCNYDVLRISNNTYPHPRKRNMLCNLLKFVGDVLLKQWKQGNTWFVKTRKRPLEIGVFFYANSLLLLTSRYRPKWSLYIPIMCWWMFWWIYFPLYPFNHNRCSCICRYNTKVNFTLSFLITNQIWSFLVIMNSNTHKVGM